MRVFDLLQSLINQPAHQVISAVCSYMRKMHQCKTEIKGELRQTTGTRRKVSVARLQKACDALMSSWCNHSFAVQVRDQTGNLPCKVSWYSSQ